MIRMEFHSKVSTMSETEEETLTQTFLEQPLAETTGPTHMHSGHPRCRTPPGLRLCSKFNLNILLHSIWSNNLPISWFYVACALSCYLQNDPGDTFFLNSNWLTFVKTRISCEVPVSSPSFHLDWIGKYFY